MKILHSKTALEFKKITNDPYAFKNIKSKEFYICMQEFILHSNTIKEFYDFLK